MKLKTKLRRLAFYLLVYDCKENVIEYWVDVDINEYIQFRSFARNHELFDNDVSIDKQQLTTLYQIMSDYFCKDIKNDFTAKYLIWIR